MTSACTSSRWLAWASGLIIACLAAPIADAHGAAKTCGGLEATIVGTNGRDVIRGTPGLDVVQALGGRDRIRRLEPRDVVCGDDGRDRVKLPAGLADPDDVPIEEPPVVGQPPNTGIGLVLGGPGPDSIIIRCDLSQPWPPGWHPGARNAWGQIWAEGGNDTIDTDCPYGDSIEGGPGDDLITYGAGPDTVLGNDGHDILIDAYSTAGDCGQPPPFDFELPPQVIDRRCLIIMGGPSPGQSVWYDWEDNAYGGPGNDIIVGGEANDLIFGEDGNDAIAGGAGADALSGGPGTDVCDGGEDDRDANQGESGPALGDCETAFGFP